MGRLEDDCPECGSEDYYRLEDEGVVRCGTCEFEYGLGNGRDHSTDPLPSDV